MKLTFTTSLALLTAASASSANGGGLRSRRLSLFAEDSSAKKKASATRASTSNAKADKSDSDEADDSTSPKSTDPGSKSAKAETKSNVIGGAKAAKAAEAANLKMESGRPYYGLSTEEDLYYFGDKIEGSFELNDETLSDAAAANFNATLINDYKIGMFPFMGRPNCAGNPAIVEVPVTIADGGTADPIDFEGTFSIDTSIDFREEGTGFDLYLMDEDGCNEILGPLAVTITLTPEEQKAEDEAAELKSKSANTPRAKAEKGKAATVKKTTYKKKKKELDPKKITVKSKEALSTEDYELATDKVEYEVEEDIVVNYRIVAAPTATAEGRRLKKNKKNKDQPESEPIEPEDEPVDEPVDEPMEEQVDEPVSDQPEPELQPDPVVSEDDEEEEGEQQPDLLPTDLAIEEATVSDPTDITKFKLGVFMKMANPQRGKLLPLHEVPLCTSDSCTAEEISAGSITISAADLDTSRYGSGYDIWILDDSGDGIAGPVFFAIDA